MQWNDLFAALALVLVVEGILPFINPTAYKRTMAQMLELPEKNLRIIGFGSMLVGVFFLFMVRN